MLRAWGAGALAAVLLAATSGCVTVGSGSAAPQSLTMLTPQGIIAGGPTASPSPLPGQPPKGRYMKLMHPAAIAARGPDIYVADIAQRALLRIDAVTQAVTPLRELPALPNVRLRSDRDGSVYIVRPGSASVERVARDGRQLGIFAERFDLLQPADIAVGPGGELWLSDAAGGVFGFHPSGRMGQPLVGRGDGFPDELGGATLLAAGRDRVFGYDPVRRSINAYDRDGRPFERFGEGELFNVADMAVDAQDRIWVVDRGDRRLKIFDRGRLVETIAPAAIGLTEITAIAVDTFHAYIADGPGGRIGVFSITPSRP